MIAITLRIYDGKPKSLSLSLLILILELVILLSSCTPTVRTQDPADCNTQAVAGIELQINNTLDTSEVCPITVQAIDHDYVEILECQPINGNCSCRGAWERPGQYEIRIYQDDSLLQTLNLEVESDICHVITEKREVMIK